MDLLVGHDIVDGQSTAAFDLHTMVVSGGVAPFLEPNSNQKKNHNLLQKENKYLKQTKTNTTKHQTNIIKQKTLQMNSPPLPF